VTGHRGRLLVATPLIGDPSFERTVVLLLDHGDDGAFGMILNRPSDVPVGEVAPAWAHQVSAPGVLFIGGPVRSEHVSGLARARDQDPAHFESLIGDLGTVDLHQQPEDGPSTWDGLRLFAGSAGWAPGQLEDEIAEGAWWALDADPDDVMTTRPDDLWVRVLRRQHGEVAWFANCPRDPSAN